jgi:uncharacterized protein with von Willebrand factor type A (vWA) domain|tara:strand:+ start:138 stop:527 length:390 start_codon:yes stop_codon:yes gene_type:complete
MEKESKDLFFVEVRGSKDVRRNILESLKDIVEALQRFEKFKETRKDKIEHINKLDNILKEINKLVPNLKSALPEAKLRAVKVRKHKSPEKKKTSAGKEEKTEAVKKPVTELQKLESELSEIEGKLQGLR